MNLIDKILRPIDEAKIQESIEKNKEICEEVCTSITMSNGQLKEAIEKPKK